jgi:hypothetical protein
LCNLGFRVLSRDRTAVPFGIDGLVEKPITVDWFGKSRGEPLTLAQIGEQIAGQISAGQTVGIMLHHAVTDAEQLRLIDRLLEVLGRHPSATSTSIYSSSM